MRVQDELVTLCLQEDVLENPTALREILEKLYLGSGYRFRLLFPVACLSKVNRTFDDIFLMNGLNLTKSFEFEFVDENPLPIK